MVPGLVIFDCDGVLVDSERLVHEVDLAMIAELGWPISLEEILDQHLGRSQAAVLANIERHLGRPVPPGFAEARVAAFEAAFVDRLEAVPGVEEAISVLQDVGVQTCVASSGSHTRIRLTLGLTGLWPTFAGRIFSAEEVERGKPAPDLFLHAAATMGVPAGSCVVVEDSPAGVRAARSAGMHVVAYCALTPPSMLAEADQRILAMRNLPRAVLTGLRAERDGHPT